MKKITLLLVVLITTTFAFARTKIGNIYYNLNGATKTAEVTDPGNNVGYTGDITIPEKVTYNATEYSVTSIGSKAFYNCTFLTSITIPNSVISIGSKAFYKCHFRTFTIPNSVTSIGSGAFWGCESLKSITIPNGVTSIESFTFAGCKDLTSITIPNSVTSIGTAAFNYCSHLTSITIPNSVTSIGHGAFQDCVSLTFITCLSSTPPQVGNLGVDTKNCTLIVPKESYNSYLHHPYWGQFLNIR